MKTIATTIVVLASVIAGSAGANQGDRQLLLNQQFEPRRVTQVEIGDFHFLPGQPAPVHTHVAPVFGYVSKGSIVYQVEGQEPVVLKEGDAFYEPVGPNILRFDNASTSEEAIFTDFNFERDGEPFIVFPKPLTAKIDRRAFPSERPGGETASAMSVWSQTLKPSTSLALPSANETVYAYVASGSVMVRVRDEAPIIYLAGQTFYAPKNTFGSQIVNASKSDAAKIVSFHLTNGERAQR